MKKIPNLLYYDLSFDPQIHRGRPRKTRVARFSPKQVDPRELYKTIINLRNDEEIEEFSKRRIFTIPGDDDQPRIATIGDIQKCQKELTSCFNLTKERKKARSTSFNQFSLHSFDNDCLEKINQYLANCRPFLLNSLVTSSEPSALEKIDFETKVEKLLNQKNHKNAISQFIIDYANPTNWKSTPRRAGGIFFQLVMQSTDSMSACVYGLVADMLDDEPVKLCSCGRVFVAKDGRQTYCGKTDCNKMRGRQAVQRNRKARKLSS